MILPGNIYERIGDLREEKGLSKKELCAELGIEPSRLTRIENETIKSIGHELIIQLAEYFHVTTDYLLGLSDIRFRKNIELEKLGLSHRAMTYLMAGKIDGRLLSLIIENKYFIPFMDVAESYFKSAHDEGFATRNEMIDLATMDIKTMVQTSAQKSEIRKDIRQLKTQKISGTEADLERIKAMFINLLRDVKEQYGESYEDISHEEMWSQVQAMHDQALQAKNEEILDVEKMVAISTMMLGQTQFDETEKNMFEELMRHVLERNRNEIKYQYILK